MYYKLSRLGHHPHTGNKANAKCLIVLIEIPLLTMKRCDRRNDSSDI